MKRSTLLLFLVSFSSTFGETSLQKEKTIVICKSCEMVHERSYFLRRLKKIIDLFQHLDKSPRVNTDFNNFSPDLFSHPRIKRLIVSLENTSNLGAFFNLWEELCDYKYINDELLIKEFTRFTLLITKKICPECYTKSTNPLDISFTLSSGSYTEAVTIRDYYSTRLKKPLELLSHIKCNKDSLFESVSRDHECNCVFESHIRFKHGDINRCIDLMSSKNSVSPLLQLGKEFSKYRLIQDEKFNREFLLLVFGVYKNLITYNALHKNLSINKSTLTLISYIYENLEHLPLEQILDATDLLSEELPHLLDNYEIKEDANWKGWLKKNWWVPPILLTTLGVKVLLIFKYSMDNHNLPSEGSGNTGFSRPYSSRPSSRPHSADSSQYDKSSRTSSQSDRHNGRKSSGSKSDRHASVGNPQFQGYDSPGSSQSERRHHAHHDKSKHHPRRSRNSGSRRSTTLRTYSDRNRNYDNDSSQDEESV